MAKNSKISGILNVNKPRGLTSHDVVERVRLLSGERRVGHAGTLDPIATGVLLICLGKATRVTEYLMSSEKVYLAEIRLGITTETNDAEGRVKRIAPEVMVSLEEVEEALSDFIGKIEQVPPMYSAIKRKGTPLYKLARRGITVERKPRLVEIYDIKVMEWSPPLLTIEVTCSPGTYIRALARDLGERLGCGGHLAGLVRTRSGRFSLEDSLSLASLEEASALGRFSELLHPLDEALLDFPAVKLDLEAEWRVIHGQSVKINNIPGKSDFCRAYSNNGDFIAILSYERETGLWRPKKVFIN
jgi:tRNA pseudouridine55 synthase